MITVSTLFFLGIAVSRYFALFGVITLAVVLLYRPCRDMLFVLHPAEAAIAPMPDRDIGDFQQVPSFVSPPMPSHAGDSRGQVAEGMAYHARPGNQPPLGTLNDVPAPTDTSLPVIPRKLDGEDNEEAKALRRIEAARESFERLDEDNAEEWGAAQDALIRELRLNNMGDDENTVSYIHPDYVDKVGRRGGDMWSHDANAMMGRNRAGFLDLEDSLGINDDYAA